MFWTRLQLQFSSIEQEDNISKSINITNFFIYFFLKYKNITWIMQEIITMGQSAITIILSRFENSTLGAIA